MINSDRPLEEIGLESLPTENPVPSQIRFVSFLLLEKFSLLLNAWNAIFPELILCMMLYFEDYLIFMHEVFSVIFTHFACFLIDKIIITANIN